MWRISFRYVMLLMAFGCGLFISAQDGDDLDLLDELDDENLDDTPTVLGYLDFTNFHHTLQKYDNVFVMFYAPFCKHSKALLPEFEGLAKELLLQGYEHKDIYLARVDAHSEKALKLENDIKSYPTLLFFRSGVRISFHGKRTRAGMMEWILQQMEGGFSEMKTLEEFQAFMEKRKGSGPVFVTQGEQANKHLKKVSKDELFAENVVSISIEEPPSEDKGAAVRVYRDKVPHTFEGSVDKYDDVKEFLMIEKLPLVGYINEHSFRDYLLSAPRGLIFAAFPPDSTEAVAELHRDSFEKVAQKFRHWGHVVWIDCNRHAEHCREELWMTEFPSVVVMTGNFLAEMQPKKKGYKAENNLRHKYVLSLKDKWIDADEIIQFVDDAAITKKLEPNKKPTKEPVNETVEEIDPSLGEVTDEELKQLEDEL